MNDFVLLFYKPLSQPSHVGERWDGGNMMKKQY